MQTYITKCNALNTCISNVISFDVFASVSSATIRFAKYIFDFPHLWNEGYMSKKKSLEKDANCFLNEFFNFQHFIRESRHSMHYYQLHYHVEPNALQCYRFSAEHCNKNEQTTEEAERMSE